MEPLIDRLPDETEKQAAVLLLSACEKELSFVTAESCTGGLLAALLTDIEGFSRAFERGFAVYSAESKSELLGISMDLVRKEGAVSQPVAVAMARGALQHSRADIALAITGFAGPGAPGDEIGLVYIACQRRGHDPRHREEYFGPKSRSAVRADALRVAIAMMSEAVESS